MADTDMTWAEVAVYAQAKGDTLNATIINMVMRALRGVATDREFVFVLNHVNPNLVRAIAMVNSPSARETP